MRLKRLLSMKGMWLVMNVTLVLIVIVASPSDTPIQGMKEDA
jgi:hypothetical protein